MDEINPPATPACVSWAPEVKADDSGNWLPNGTRFATEDEAKGYVFNLSMRWLAVKESQVPDCAYNCQIPTFWPRRKPFSRWQRHCCWTCSGLITL
jgi:hypothetical protein